MERAYHIDKKYKDRIIALEYYCYPESSPLFQQNRTYSLEFSQPPTGNSFQHSASVNYSFNRQLTGWWLPPAYMQPFDESAAELVEECKLDEEAPALVEINHNYNEASRTVTGMITVTFDRSVPSDKYNLGLYIVEQYITGPSPEYIQSSDFIAITPENPHVNDSNYVFNDIIRSEIIGNSIWGGDFINGEVEIGKKYTKEFSYMIPDKYIDLAPKIENIELIPFVVRIDDPVSQQDLDSGIEKVPAKVGDPRGVILNVTRQKLTTDDYNEYYHLYIDNMNSGGSGGKYRPGDIVGLKADNENHLGEQFTNWTGDTEIIVTGDVSSQEVSVEIPHGLGFLFSGTKGAVPLTKPEVVHTSAGIVTTSAQALTLSEFDSQIAKVRLYRINGQVLFQKDITLAYGAKKIPFSNAMTGVVVLQIETDSKIVTEKLLLK